MQVHHIFTKNEEAIKESESDKKVRMVNGVLETLEFCVLLILFINIVGELRGI